VGPRRIECFDGIATDVAAGWCHSAVLTTKGIYTFGSNECNQLGRKGNIKQPGMVMEFSSNQFVFVACGSWHTMAINSQGNLFGWGDNRFGQVGESKKSSVRYPTAIQSLVKVQHVACG